MLAHDLEGRELDRWVALAEGYRNVDIGPDARGENAGRMLAPPGLLESGWVPAPLGRPADIIPPFSTNWAIGGPIIHRMLIDVSAPEEFSDDQRWYAGMYRGDARRAGMKCEARGDTPLIAAMRCRVIAAFGETLREDI